MSHLNIFNLLFRLVKFILIIILSMLVYQALFSRIFTNQLHIVTYLLFWFFSAYFVLPKVNRFLVKIYVPDYFIGRTQTNDGLLGDPVNLVFYGTKEEIIAAFTEQGWHPADPLTFKTSVKIAVSSILGRSYATAPVSPLFLFTRKQDLAFEMDVGGNPRKRHHVRFWQVADDWYLPGGRKADWLAAATFDRNIGLSLFTGQITHKIDRNVDNERQFVLDKISESKHFLKGETVPHFTPGYNSRNGSGDHIHTDGALVFITLSASALSAQS